MNTVFVIITLMLAAMAVTFGWYICSRLLIIVPKGTVALLERDGKLLTTLTAGRHIRRPKDNLKVFSPDGQKKTRFIDITRQELPVIGIEAVTADGLIMEIEATAAYQVTDPVTVAYKGYDVTELAERIIRKAVRKMISDKQSIVVENFLPSIIEGAANKASGMAIRHGIKITVQKMAFPENEGKVGELTIEDQEEEDTYGEDPEEYETEGEDIAEEKKVVIPEGPLTKEMDEFIDMTEKIHILVDYPEDSIGFRNMSHLMRFLDDLFRADRNQEEIKDRSARNIYAFRQQDGTFKIVKGSQVDSQDERQRLVNEAEEILRDYPCSTIARDEVLVNLYRGEVRYCREAQQLKPLEEEQEGYIFQHLTERYETGYPAVAILAMHNDQDYGSGRVMNHIHRIFIAEKL